MEPPLYLKKNFVFKELLTKKKEHPWSCHRMTGAKERPSLARLPDLLAGTNSRPGLGLWENPRSYKSLRRACLSIQLTTSLSRRPSPGFFHSVGASRARSGGRCISFVLTGALGLRGLDSSGRSPRSEGPARRPVFLTATPQGSAESQGPYTHEVGEGRREPLTLGAPLLGIMTDEPAADLNWDVRTDL